MVVLPTPPLPLIAIFIGVLCMIFYQERHTAVVGDLFTFNR